MIEAMTTLRNTLFIITPTLALLLPLDETALYLLAGVAGVLGGVVAWWLAKYPIVWQHPVPPSAPAIAQRRKAA